MSLVHDAFIWSEVCECGISWSNTLANSVHYLTPDRGMIFQTIWYVRPAKAQTSLRIHDQSPEDRLSRVAAHIRSKQVSTSKIVGIHI